MADISRINGYDIKDSLSRGEIEKLNNNKADRSELNGLATTDYVNAAIRNAEINGGSSSGANNAYYVNVRDFGAVGDGSTDDTQAFREAIAYCNATWSNPEWYFGDTHNRGMLVVPDGNFIITDTLHITGAYDVEIIGSMVYRGEGGKTFVKIGNDEQNILGCKYTLNGHSDVRNVIGFETVNLLNCIITVRKIANFEIGMVCAGRNDLGWCGNDTYLGTFYNNIVDVDVTCETGGWPNGNHFRGGFLIKEDHIDDPLVVEQNCIRFRKLDDSLGMTIDTNVFENVNFENGKLWGSNESKVIPIRLEYGSCNRFLNIRVEHVTDRCLAYLDTYENIIEVRGSYDSTERIIGSGEQHAFAGRLSDLKVVYDSGSLGLTAVETNGRVYHPTLSFNNRSSATCSCLSGNDGDRFTISNDALQLLDGNSVVRASLKVNRDRFFHVDVQFANGTINQAIKCYDAGGEALPLTNNDLVSDADWGSNFYIKTNKVLPFMEASSVPDPEGGYLTPYTGIGEYTFEVHPDVAYVEVAVLSPLVTGVGDGATPEIRKIVITSDQGSAQIVDFANDRNEYMQIGDAVYQVSNSNGTLRLTDI